MQDKDLDQMIDNPGEITPQEAQAEAEEQSISIEALQRKVEELDGFTAKNREENAKYREKNRLLAKKLEAYEREKSDMSVKNLEDQGQFKALWKLEKEKRVEAEKKSEDFFQQVQAEKTSSQFKDIAAAHGCNDPTLAFITANNKYQDMIEFNPETLSADQSSLGAVVERMKIDHPSLFRAGPVTIKDGQPSKVKSGPKDVKEMKNTELLKLWAEQLDRQG